MDGKRPIAALGKLKTKKKKKQHLYTFVTAAPAINFPPFFNYFVMQVPFFVLF
jgi:hypothetical protein